MEERWVDEIELARCEMKEHQVARGEMEEHQVARGEMQEHLVAHGEIELACSEMEEHQVAHGEMEQHQVAHGEMKEHQVAHGEMQDCRAACPNHKTSCHNESHNVDSRPPLLVYYRKKKKKPLSDHVVPPPCLPQQAATLRSNKKSCNAHNEKTSIFPSREGKKPCIVSHLREYKVGHMVLRATVSRAKRNKAGTRRWYTPSPDCASVEPSRNTASSGVRAQKKTVYKPKKKFMGATSMCDGGGTRFKQLRTPSLRSEAAQQWQQIENNSPLNHHQPIGTTANGACKPSRLSAMRSRVKTAKAVAQESDDDECDKALECGQEEITEPTEKPKRKKHRPKVQRERPKTCQKVQQETTKTKMARGIPKKSTKRKAGSQDGLRGGKRDLPRKRGGQKGSQPASNMHMHPFQFEKDQVGNREKCIFKKGRTLLPHNNDFAGLGGFCLINGCAEVLSGIRFQYHSNSANYLLPSMNSTEETSNAHRWDIQFREPLAPLASRELTLYIHPGERLSSALYGKFSDQHEAPESHDNNLLLCLPSVADTSSMASTEFSQVGGSNAQLVLAKKHCLPPTADNKWQTVLYDQRREMILFKAPKEFRKVRAKVPIDPENERIWPLLALGSIPTDFQDPQYWERERELMKRRVEIFIHRMHYVQGDRHFSPWKGSVLDSVVGAFLTQNVSDHLSSSAFMSVASRFPPVRKNDTEGTHPPEAVETPPEVKIDARDLQSRNVRVSRSVGEKPLGKQGDIERSKAVEVGNCEVDDTVHDKKKHCFSFHNGKPAVSTIEIEGGWRNIPTSIPDLNFLDEMGAGGLGYVSTNMLDLQPLETEDLNSSISNDETSASVAILEENKSGDHTVIEKSWQGIGTQAKVKGNKKVCRRLFDLDVTKDECPGTKQAKYQSGETVLGTHSFQQSESVASKVATTTMRGIKFTNPQAATILQHSSESDTNPQAATIHKNSSQLLAGSVTKVPRSVLKIGKKRRLCNISGIERAHIEENLHGRKKNNSQDWESMRKQTLGNSYTQHKRVAIHEDSAHWEAVRRSKVEELAESIKERGMHHVLSGRIKAFLKTLDEEHGSMNLEWLRKLSPEDARAYLMSIHGLGVKSTECIRLLTLHHVAFPVDVNVGRICVRLGWVPIKPLPEQLQLHLLELYPMQETVQKYLWPRLCTLDQKTLYEFHYQLITFGKVFCTKSKPNCNACPMRTECKHFASAYASAKLLLTGPEDEQSSRICLAARSKEFSHPSIDDFTKGPIISEIDSSTTDSFFCNNQSFANKHTFSIEEPASPEETLEEEIIDLEDFPYIYKDYNDFTAELLSAESLSESCVSPNGQVSCVCEDIDSVYVQSNPSPSCACSEGGCSGFHDSPFATKAGPCGGYQSISSDSTAASPSPDQNPIFGEEASNAVIPIHTGLHKQPPQLKKVSRLRTVHYVYELPDTHPLLEKAEPRQKDDPSSYLLAIWSPGEIPESKREIQELCNSCPCSDGNDNETVSGTLLIPCRTAMQGTFPLNGTYFQVNEVFADHESSLEPFQVPRSLIWELQRRYVYFGTSVTNIFKDFTTDEIKDCFSRGHVCVRGFDRRTRAPKPLVCRLHFSISRQKSKKGARAEN